MFARKLSEREPAAAPATRARRDDSSAVLKLVDEPTLADKVQHVAAARWEGFKSLAAVIGDDRLLAVEMVRTQSDETVAVFTTVQDGEPVRTVVRGDARGWVLPAELDELASDGRARAPAITSALIDGEEDVLDPSALALGVHEAEPGTPDIASVAGQLLASAFSGDPIDLVG